MTALTLDKETIAAEAADWVARAEELVEMVESLKKPAPPPPSPAKRLRQAADRIAFSAWLMDDRERAVELLGEVSMFRSAAALLDGAPDDAPLFRERLNGMTARIEGAKAKSAPSPLDDILKTIAGLETWRVSAERQMERYREGATDGNEVLESLELVHSCAASAVTSFEDICKQGADESLCREAAKLASRAVSLAEEAMDSCLKDMEPTP